jgi:hypothetical protein
LHWLDGLLRSWQGLIGIYPHSFRWSRCLWRGIANRRGDGARRLVIGRLMDRHGHPKFGELDSGFASTGRYERQVFGLVSPKVYHQSTRSCKIRTAWTFVCHPRGIATANIVRFSDFSQESPEIRSRTAGVLGPLEAGKSFRPKVFCG